jgi:hypothetical protein
MSHLIRASLNRSHRPCGFCGRRITLTRVQAAGRSRSLSPVAYGALVLWREAWLLSALRPPPLSPFLAFTIAP